MKKHFPRTPALSFIILLAALSPAKAQFRYIFKDTTTAYAPLAAATSLNAGMIWDDENLAAPIPFTWKMDSTISLNNFTLMLGLQGVFADSNSFTDMNGFMPLDANIADRGSLAGTTSLSNIRYATTGAAPNRIFKVELANAGFRDELDIYNTMSDFINVQIWVYETKNIVEFHYGPSQISHPTDYFTTGINGGPFVSYISHLDFISANSGKFYNLKGNPAAPGLDTFSLPPTSLPACLNAWPASGKVYRFTPRNGCTVVPVSAFTAGAPSGKKVQYTYAGTAGVDSVRWNFGDGTTSAALSPQHTFATNGKYNVCLTVYKSCGSATFCKQTPLAIGDLSGAAEVKVYPNPASNRLNIEGMQDGGTALVMSPTGQRLLSHAIHSDKVQLDISALSSGIYILVLTDKTGISNSIRITKQ